jgi:hypothetical protein
MKKIIVSVALLMSTLMFSQESISVNQRIQGDNLSLMRQTITYTDSLVHVDYKNEKYIDYDMKVDSFTTSTVGDVESRVYICESPLNPQELVRMTFMYNKGKFLILTEEKFDPFTRETVKIIWR